MNYVVVDEHNQIIIITSSWKSNRDYSIMELTPIIYHINVTSTKLFTATCYKNRKWREYLEVYNINKFIHHIYETSEKLTEYNKFKSNINKTNFIMNLYEFLKVHKMLSYRIINDLENHFNNDIKDYINYYDKGIINDHKYFFPK